MEGENHGKPLLKLMIRGKTHYFWKTPTNGSDVGCNKLMVSWAVKLLPDVFCDVFEQRKDIGDTKKYKS